ncbi:MAG: Crp/Fnr family transcriptional regulator [bacterium]|nr:Crp/Fnr family transcriptional regulator [bacterium]
MDSDNKYWYLRNHKLFRVLSNMQLKQLCIITGFKKAKKGDVIYLFSSDAPKIYFLKKGNIKIAEIDDEGNEITKEIIQKGDLFGELSLDTTIKSNEYAQALTNDVAICSFLLSDFEALMEKHPGLALSYSKFVGLRFKKMSSNYSNLIFKDARSRLIYFLKEWSIREGIFEGMQVKLLNYLTQQDMAQIICTSRQTITQLLNDFEKDGLLTYNRQEIMISDFSRFK